MSDQELNQQELNRVSNALDALQQHNNQPSTNAWEAIMEESNKRGRGLSRRTQLLSAAATIAVIVAVTATVIVSSNNDDNKKIKTVEEKKKETTQTTVPLTAEQKLLQNTVTVKRTYFGEYDSGAPRDSTLSLIDNSTGKEIKGFKEFLEKANLFDPSINFAGSTIVAVADGGSPSCDKVTYHYFNIKTGESFTAISTLGMYREYSPSGNKYAQLENVCFVDNGNVVEPQGKNSFTIVDVASGKERKIGPESFIDFSGQKGFVYVNDFMWFDDDQALIGTTSDLSDGVSHTVVSLDEEVSLNDEFRSENNTACITGTDGSLETLDVAKVGNKLLCLEVEIDMSTSNNPPKAIVKDANTGAIIWTKSFSDNDLDGIGSSFLLNEDGTEIFGSVFRGDGEGAFIYDSKTDRVIKPTGNENDVLPAESNIVFKLR